MNITSVTSKGQVTIPLNIRQKLGIYKGSKLRFVIVDDHVELHIEERTEPMSQSGFGLLKSSRKSVPVDFDPASLLMRIKGIEARP